MAQGKTTDQTSLYRDRRSFAKIPDVMDVPNLIAIQTDSFEFFKGEGLAQAFQDISPIENNTKDMCVEFGRHEFGEPKYTVDECKEKDVSYQAPLFVEIRFINRETGEIKEQDVFMGDFPLMTPRGTFIINGTERVVVSQLVRSPGVYFASERDKASDKTLFNAKVIPSRGAWLEFETDKRDILSVRIDRKRKQPATLLVRALGLAETREEIIELLGNDEMVLRTLDRDPATTKEESLIELYKRFRPGEPPTIDSARTLLEGLFFNPQRYDLAKVGRYKINKKLGFDPDYEASTLTDDDIVRTMQYIVALHAGDEGVQTDDIDHFGNRRIRTVGELIQNQFRIGLSRMERVVRERMSMQEPDEITPQSLVNIRPIVAAIKEFFGSSQLSQFMDQTNPAAGITHKRRLSALGPGGLSRERAGFEVRDVHTSHYGRMCPIETPEGPNIGLIGSLATYARINPYGFIETPYRRVVDGKVTDEVDYLTADEEENYTIAQANDLFDPETRKFGTFDDQGVFHEAVRVLCRTKDAAGVFGEPDEVAPELVNYMDVSPRQMVSVATSLIPFLEHDDANRALMGSNMQRQAVPLLRPDAPLVGTGIEHRIAVDSGEILVAQNPGVVDYVDGQTIIVLNNDGEYDEYLVPKFQRSNQSGCINHRPIVRKGDEVQAGDELAPGVNELVRIYVAQKRKVQQGDKLSGRHGNKGVISRVLPVEDMPYLADGTPIDVILNPLGVPSRMNVGQLLENHLGWAAKWGWDDAEETDAVVEGPMHVATPVFDGATEKEISDAIEKANRNLINKNHATYGDLARDEFVPQLSRTGKTWLYDGRTGEKFREPITVGQSYILKLGHMVDDKIHARSTGPYSLITQQPLGGKAQFGGQRFGEMEVWALYAYGASNVLQEILTVKSDDTAGRVKSYEAIVKGENIPAPEVPESFKVLVKEMKSLCLNVELEGHDHRTIDVTQDIDGQEDGDRALYEAIAADARKTEEDDAANALDSIAAELGELMGDSNNDTNDLIGEGEER